MVMSHFISIYHFVSEESGAAMLHYAPNYNGVLLAEALNQVFLLCFFISFFITYDCLLCSTISSNHGTLFLERRKPLRLPGSL